MSDPFMIAVGIIGDRDLTEQVLDEVMDMLSVLPQTKSSDLESVKRQLETTIGIRMLAGEGLSDGETRPWVEDVKATTAWRYWDSYVQQLRSDGFPAPVIRTLDEDTDNILTECGNPAMTDSWRIQGLVMGDVQSGKTASYCGLISKAADTGYRMIVLLTGTIEDLRSQSQERLDEGFVGTDSRTLLNGEVNGARIGAGRFREHIANVLTSIDSDFLTGNRRALRGIALQNISQPVLLVMKKNKSALENLITYLRSQTPSGTDRLRIPLFLVDDEADNASVNAREDESPATINRLIRDVIDRFNRVAYVAYTATPFANVFINPEPDDLFPQNFIYTLNAPTSYIGAASIFSDGGAHNEQIVDIDDAENVFPEKHKKTLEITALPASLQNALAVFLLSCAIRDLRKEPLRHRSMLVNVTRFTDVQGRLADVLKSHLYLLIEEIKQYMADDGTWSRHSSLSRLQELFEQQYAECGFNWDTIRKQLYDSIASVKVLTINQKSQQDQRLNFRAYKDSEKGRRVIAVGGQTLSRGITLEGLCVSYFYRNSRAYDTLLQMGRWFGYRPRYEDLCRVYMSTAAQRWFAHIADVVAELRSDIRRMHVHRQPPRLFGIRVRSDPETLLVTAANKMRNSSEVSIDLSFSLRMISTAYLPKSPRINLSNTNATDEFLRTLGAAMPRETGRYWWTGVDAEKVADFLQRLQISPMNSAFIPDPLTKEIPLIRFIRTNAVPELQKWDVRIAEGSGAPAEGIQVRDNGGALVRVGKRERQFEGRTSDDVAYLKVNRLRVGDISDEMVGIPEEELRSAESAWRAGEPGREGKTVPGVAYLSARTRPLITVHAIVPTKAREASKTDGASGTKPRRKKRVMLDPESIDCNQLIAVSLSFPGFEESAQTAVPYRLNRVYLQSLGLLDDDGSEEDDD